MKLTVQRFPGFLLIAAVMFLPQACSDNNFGPEINSAPTLETLTKRAAIGSTIVGVVEESSTACITKCVTTTRRKTVSIRVGNSPKDLQPVNSVLAAASVEHGDTTYSVKGFDISVRGHKLTATKVRSDGSHWSIDVKADQLGRVIDHQFKKNGELTYEDHIEWDSVAGVWFQKSIDIKLRANGKDLVTKRKTFTPTGQVTSTVQSGGTIELFTDGAKADCNWDEPCLPMPLEQWNWFYSAGTAVDALDMVMDAMQFGSTWMGTVVQRGIVDPTMGGELAIEMYGAYLSPSYWTIIPISYILYNGSPWIQEHVDNWLSDAGEWIIEKISSWLNNLFNGDPNEE